MRDRTQFRSYVNGIYLRSQERAAERSFLFFSSSSGMPSDTEGGCRSLSSGERNSAVGCDPGPY